MTPRHWIIPAYLVLCILLGGSTQGGILPNLILQLLSLPIIIWSLARKQRDRSRPARALLILLAAILVLILVQFIPLPPGIWSSLPGREHIAEGFALLGQPLPWLPLSLSPRATLASTLWLLPALAAVLGIIRLGGYRPSILAWCLIGVVVVSVLVGALQLGGGRAGGFYFYQVTNVGLGVGFFANSNHQATLLLCTIPFVAALYLERRKSRSSKGASGLLVALVGIALVLVVGIVIGGSLAGVGLGAAVALASFLMIRHRSRPVAPWVLPAAAAALLGAVALIFFGPLSGGALIKDAQTSSAPRELMVQNTAEASADYFPLGSGIGTFPAVYRAYEDPATIRETWINHAHNDVVEIVLETGLPGLVLMLLFFVWWARRSYHLWAGAEAPDHFARAAVIASGAIIAHSLVDYPLRTAAISALFAVCLALMAQPRPSAKAHARGRAGEDQVKHLSA